LNGRLDLIQMLAPVVGAYRVERAVKGLPGVTATVLAADGQAWSGAAGTADGVHPVEVNSQFSIASITKTVIASEVMRLSEEGLLRLSDPVSEHLPSDFHFDTNGATIENLLHMESGIPDPALSFTAAVVADPLREWKIPEILATVPPERSKPGEQFVYGDSNYMLLVLVIEATTGTNVTSALRSDVLADHRFSSMVYQPAERPKGPLALPFVDGKLRPNIIEVGGGYLPTKAEASEANGSGCMGSDSGALALWGYLLFGGKLLSAKSLLAMTDFGNGVYGLGVYDQTRNNAWLGADQAIGNGGWDNGGYSSVLAVLPSRGIVITVMTNTAGDPKTLVFPVAEALASSLQKQG
jgi:D-alanyl-D-alanine carboxypeptidase